MRLFSDIYVLRLVIVFNALALLAAFAMGCTATKYDGRTSAPAAVNAPAVAETGVR